MRMSPDAIAPPHRSAAPATMLAVVLCMSGLLGHCRALAAEPPPAPVRAVVDTYHGVDVVDPYRWLEDPADPEAQAWIKAQARHADEVLQALPERDAILHELQALGQTTTFIGGLQRRGERLFYLRYVPGADAADLVTRTRIDDEPRVVFDPAAIGDEDARWSIGMYAASPDGRHVLVLVAPGGNEAYETRVIETATGRDLGIRITRTYGDDAYVPQWLPDGSGFLYFRLRDLAADAAPTELYARSRAYVHRLRDDGRMNDPGQDRAIFGHAVDPGIDIAPELVSGVYAPAGSDWLVARANSTVSAESEYWVAPRRALDDDARIPWRRLASLDDKVTQVEVRGDTAWLLAFRDAPRRRVLRLSLHDADLSHADVVVPEQRAVLQQLAATQDAVYVEGMEAGLTRLWRLDEDGRALVPILRHEDSSAFLVPNAISVDSDALTYTLESYAHSRRYFLQQGVDGTPTDLALAPPDPVDRSDIELTLVHVPSHDGVEVPVMLAHRRGLPRDGRNPAFLYGYGAYGVNVLDPARWMELLPLLRRGMLVAVAGVRGGGEYGADWHRAGLKQTKPNTWKDAIAVAQWLVDAGYTAPAHLGIGGASAGGILAGNAITERPDLFAAALLQVGLSNPLRMEFTANGATNLPELGSVATREGFDALLAMDAYHKLRDGTAYPAVLLTHGINDPRVEPWFSAKMAARLQATSNSGNPVLLRIDYDAGHGIGSGMAQINAEAADIFAFLLSRLRPREDARKAID